MCQNNIILNIAFWKNTFLSIKKKNRFYYLIRIPKYIINTVIVNCNIICA